MRYERRSVRVFFDVSVLRGSLAAKVVTAADAVQRRRHEQRRRTPVRTDQRYIAGHEASHHLPEMSLVCTIPPWVVGAAQAGAQSIVAEALWGVQDARRMRTQTAWIEWTIPSTCHLDLSVSRVCSLVFDVCPTSSTYHIANHGPFASLDTQLPWVVVPDGHRLETCNRLSHRPSPRMRTHRGCSSHSWLSRSHHPGGKQSSVSETARPAHLEKLDRAPLTWRSTRLTQSTMLLKLV